MSSGRSISIVRPRIERRYLVGIVLTAALMAILYNPWFLPAGEAASFEVDRFDDDPAAMACTAAPNDCSLRGAIITANADAILDTITVPPGTYTLTQVGPGENAGDLDITQDLSLIGAGPGTTIIDGNGAVTGERVFEVANSTVDISGVKITGGSDTHGGGIRVFGSLTLANCELSGNSASSLGGAIYTFRSDLTISNCTLSDNHALGTASGGAINSYTDDITDTLSIENSSITNNDAALHGGGISSTGDMVTIMRTTLSGNQALGGDGGAIYKNDGLGNQIEITDATIESNSAAGTGGGLHFAGQTSAVILGTTVALNNAASEDAFDGGGGIRQASTSLNITNSTISGNSATNNGGGILTGPSNGGTTLTNVTITDNSADSDSVGGGIGGGVYSGFGTFAFVNTIIAGNSGSQCASVGGGTLTSIESNLSSDSSCNLGNPSDLPATASGLGPLADNGGFTETHALLPGSAAIDAGHATFCPVDDQRNTDRPIGPICDIGAYEAPIWLFLPLIMR